MYTDYLRKNATLVFFCGVTSMFIYYNGSSDLEERTHNRKSLRKLEIGDFFFHFITLGFLFAIQEKI